MMTSMKGIDQKDIRISFSFILLTFIFPDLLFFEKYVLLVDSCVIFKPLVSSLENEITHSVKTLCVVRRILYGIYECFRSLYGLRSSKWRENLRSLRVDPVDPLFSFMTTLPCVEFEVEFLVLSFSSFVDLFFLLLQFFYCLSWFLSPSRLCVLFTQEEKEV